MVVPGIGSLPMRPGRLSGEGAMLVGVETGETLDLPLFSTGDFLAKDSSEFLNMAAEVRFSRREPEFAMALAKKGGKLVGRLTGGNPGGSLDPDEGPAWSILGGGNFCC
jgi:hypothetical protein